jgi:hypothetical protein
MASFNLNEDAVAVAKALDVWHLWQPGGRQLADIERRLKRRMQDYWFWCDRFVQCRSSKVQRGHKGTRVLDTGYERAGQRQFVGRED